jgi:DNA helicase-2/ATP-dependent DNA helicase PcrA
LEQNYRSTKNILESASSMVAHNLERKGKWLWTSAPAGLKVGLYQAPDAETEALFIADTIERLLEREPRDRVAILYRTNAQSRQIEEALRRYGRSYKVIGGFSFYQRAEIKDALAYLKLILSPQDSVSLLRIVNTPARGIGKTTVDQVERYANANSMSLWDALGRLIEARGFPARAEAALVSFRKLIEELREAAAREPVDELIEQMLERTGYLATLKRDESPSTDARLENLAELVNAASEAADREEGLSEFLDHAALVSDADQVDEQAQVSLLTAHNAKGLEFPVVFVAGLEENLFPHIRSVDSESALEEERRLCYVAMTRAQKQLILTWARYRRRFGGGQSEECMASRFLREIPAELIETLGRPRAEVAEVDLEAERFLVREGARKNAYTGKTYNSEDNIQEFFQARGVPASVPQAQPASPAVRPHGPVRSKGLAAGSTVIHPVYGKGTVVRREGDGENAKLTVSFQNHGLKKLVEKYAGLKTRE